MGRREQIAGYRVRTVLGAGGMGTVFAVDAPDGGEPLALKIVETPSPLLVDALVREIRALAALSHPGVPPIVAHGVEDGAPWYAMPLLGGRSLRDAWGAGAALPTLDPDGVLPEPSAPILDLGARIEPLIALCETLAYVHGEGVVHGDLKPDNVVLDDAGLPHLVDFGLAARIGGREPSESLGPLPVGTPSYLAPERFDGSEADARSDLYALGCLVFEACTGRPPFVGGRAPDLARQHRLAPVPLPSTIEPETPAALDALVASLLAKDPAERLGHAMRVADALGRVTPRWAGAPPARPVLYRPRLVGREVGAVAARVGPGRIVALIGPAGIGKTRLAAAVLRALAGEGWRVVTAGAPPPDAVGPARDLLASLGEPGDLLAPPAAGRRLLCVDDLQWVDPEVLPVLGGLVRAGAAMIATCRSDAPPAVARWLARADRIPLGDLPPEAIGSIVADMLGDPDPPEPLIAAVAALAPGQPLAATELVRTAVREGAVLLDARGAWQVDPEALARLPAPTDPAALLARRLDGLDPLAIHVLRAAAAIGPRVEPALAVALAGAPPDSVHAALRELLLAGILTEREGALYFAHEQLREAAWRLVPEAERPALHAHLAAVLPAFGWDRPEDLAWHTDGAGDRETARAQHLAAGLPGGAHERERRRRHLERYLALSAEAPDDPRRPEALLALALLVGLESEVDRASALREEALALAQRLGRPDDELLALSGLLTQAVARSDLPTVDRRARALVARLPAARDPAVIQRVCLAAAGAAHRLHRSEEVAAWAARTLAVPGGDPLVGSRALGVLARERWVEGRLDEAADAAERAVDMARSAPVPHPRTVADAWFVLGIVRNEQGRSDEAELAYQHAMALFGEARDRRGVGHTWGNLAGVYHAREDWPRAADALQRALVVLRLGNDDYNLATTLTNLADLHLRLGEIAAARTVIAEARSVEQRLGAIEIRIQVERVSVRLDRLDGAAPAGLRPRIEALIAEVRDYGEPSEEVRLLVELAEVERALGAHGGQAAAVARARALLDGMGAGDNALRRMVDALG